MSADWPPEESPDTPGPYVPPGYDAGYTPPGGSGVPSGIGRGAGPVPLRPLQLADFLDGMFKLLTANARELLLLAAAFAVPVQLVSAYVAREQLAVGFMDFLGDPEALTMLEQQASTGVPLASLAVEVVATGLVLPLVVGAVSRLVAASYLGEDGTGREAMTVATRRGGALVGAWWLHAISYALCLAPGVLLLAGGGLAQPSGGAALLLLLGIVAALALVPLFTAVAPAVVIEHAGPAAALRRSARLCGDRYWRTTGIVVLTSLVIGLITSLLGAVPSVAGQFVGGDWAWVLVALGGIIGTTLSIPLVAIVATLIYFDARIRQEGFDLQLLAADVARDTAGWPGGPTAGGAPDDPGPAQR